MEYKEEVFDIDDLREVCWSCDEVFDFIEENDLEKEAFSIIEDAFSGDEIPRLVEINDFIRFRLQDLLEYYVDDEDEDDYDDEDD